MIEQMFYFVKAPNNVVSGSSMFTHMEPLRDPTGPRRVHSLAALGGGIAALAVDALYLAAIAQQGVQPPGGRVPFVAAWIAAAGLAAIVGAGRPSPRRRALVLGASAAALAALGVPAMWSVGIPLLLCAACVAVGAARAAEEASLPAWVGVAGPVALVAIAGLALALGFTLTER